MVGPSNDLLSASGQVENPNAQLNDDDDDTSVYESSHTSGSSNNDQASAGAALPNGKLDKQTRLNEEIARLEAKE